MREPDQEPGQYGVERYFEMAECGIIAPDDRVELLEGLIVAMSPQSPSHCATIHRVQLTLQRRLGLDVVVRVQMSFVAGHKSVPEPDIAVVPGVADEYFKRHPSQAHLIVEVAESSVIQDRITKAAIYARAGIPCYWIVNVRNRCVEVFREPDRFKAEYTRVVRATGPESFSIDGFPDVTFSADELLPPDPGDDEF